MAILSAEEIDARSERVLKIAGRESKPPGTTIKTGERHSSFQSAMGWRSPAVG